MNNPATKDQVLNFWFGDSWEPGTLPSTSKMWFERSDETDRMMRERFEFALLNAAKGACESWVTQTRGRLALIILLDQFSRNIFRGTSQAFAQDARALSHCLESIKAGEDLRYDFIERVFIYLPLEHSESLHLQEQSVKQFTELADTAPAALKDYLKDNLRYAVRHHEIIERFGRFPHRNAILGRTSTPEEVAFLSEPMSSF